MKRIFRKLLKKMIPNIKHRNVLRSLYSRMKLRIYIVVKLFKYDGYVPFVPLEHFYSPFPALSDIKQQNHIVTLNYEKMGGGGATISQRKYPALIYTKMNSWNY